MHLPTRLTAALASLATALDDLERATQRRSDDAHRSADDVAALRRENDRMRLAAEHGENRIQTLLAASDDVRTRLGRVAQALRDDAERDRPVPAPPS